MQEGSYKDDVIESDVVDRSGLKKEVDEIKNNKTTTTMNVKAAKDKIILIEKDITFIENEMEVCISEEKVDNTYIPFSMRLCTF